MKIQVDFDNKVISLQETVDFGEFMNKIKRMFPNGEWREFSLAVGFNNIDINPIVINPEPYWYKPYWENPVWSDDSEKWMQGVTGIYSLEVR